MAKGGHHPACGGPHSSGQVTHPPIKSSSKMGNTKPSCTAINMLLDDGKEISAGPIGGPPCQARISTLSAVTRDQDKRTQPETRVLIFLFQMKTPTFSTF